MAVYVTNQEITAMEDRLSGTMQKMQTETGALALRLDVHAAAMKLVVEEANVKSQVNAYLDGELNSLDAMRVKGEKRLDERISNLEKLYEDAREHFWSQEQADELANFRDDVDDSICRLWDAIGTHTHDLRSDEPETESIGQILLQSCKNDNEKSFAELQAQIDDMRTTLVTERNNHLKLMEEEHNEHMRIAGVERDLRVRQFIELRADFDELRAKLTAKEREDRIMETSGRRFEVSRVPSEPLSSGPPGGWSSSSPGLGWNCLDSSIGSTCPPAPGWMPRGQPPMGIFMDAPMGTSMSGPPPIRPCMAVSTQLPMGAAIGKSMAPPMPTAAKFLPISR